MLTLELWVGDSSIAKLSFRSRAIAPNSAPNSARANHLKTYDLIIFNSRYMRQYACTPEYHMYLPTPPHCKKRTQGNNAQHLPGVRLLVKEWNSLESVRTNWRKTSKSSPDFLNTIKVSFQPSQPIINSLPLTKVTQREHWIMCRRRWKMLLIFKLRLPLSLVSSD